MAVPTTRNDFEQMVLQNKYSKWYFSIVDNAIKRNWHKNSIDFYVEEHHYVPKSLGGDDSSTVILTAREHFICHALLVRMLSGKSKSKMAWALMMLKGNSSRYVNSYLYESTKRSIRHSEESKLKMSNTRINQGTFSGLKNPMWGKRGILSPHYGKQQTTEHKESRLSKVRGRIHSEESKLKMSQNRARGPSGKKWFNNGIIEKFDLPENKPIEFDFGRLTRRV